MDILTASARLAARAYFAQAGTTDLDAYRSVVPEMSDANFLGTATTVAECLRADCEVARTFYGEDGETVREMMHINDYRNAFENRLADLYREAVAE